jgi:sporulation protein YabP
MNDNIYKTHDIKLLNRELLSLSGIKKIINFDDSEFILSSVMGNILVKGKNLELLLLDTDKGEVKIKGKINNILYSDSKKENKENIFTKLFK